MFFSQLLAYLFRLWQYNIDLRQVGLLMKTSINPIWNIFPFVHWTLLKANAALCTPHKVSYSRSMLLWLYHLFLVKRLKCSAILSSLPQQLNLVPRSSRLTAHDNNLAISLHNWRHQFRYRKILPNLVDISCLWWNMQKRRNILKE